MSIISPTLNLVAHPKYTGFDSGYLKNSNAGPIATNALGKGYEGKEFELRRDYHPTTRELLGFLLEKAKTNYITGTDSNRHIRNKSSSAFNTGWSGTSLTTSNISAVTGDGFAAIGTTPNWYCTSISSPVASGRAIYTTNAVLAVNTKYTFSAYVKSVTADGAAIKIFAGSTSISYNISTTGWTRIYVGFTASGSTASIGFEFPTAGNVFLIDCMQLEAGDISSALGDRYRDELTFPDTNGNTFDLEQGTVFIQYRTSDNAAKISGEKIALFMLGAASGWSIAGYALTTAGTGAANPDTVTVLQTLNSSLTDPSSVTKAYANSTSPRIHKVAVSFKKSLPLKLCVDGQAVATGASPIASWGAYNANPTLYIGHGFWNLALDSHLQQITYFPAYMEDADLVSLTS